MGKYSQTAKETLQIGSQVKQYLRKVKHGYLEDLNTYIVGFNKLLFNNSLSEKYLTYC